MLLDTNRNNKVSEILEPRQGRREGEMGWGKCPCPGVPKRTRVIAGNCKSA